MKTSSASLLSMLLLLICASCEKHSLTKKTKPEPPTENGGTKKWLPVNIKSDDLALKFEYKQGTSLLTKISESENKYILITYAPKYYRVESFERNVLYHYADFLLADDRATKVHSFDSFGKVDVPSGHRVFGYNTKDELADVKDYNVANQLVMQRKMSFTTGGNLSSIEFLDHANKSEMYRYTSDDKNGIFKHIGYARSLFLEIPYDFFCADSNNWLSYQNTPDHRQDITYNYEYNGEGYPSKLTLTRPDGKKIFHISYKELEE